MAYTIIGALLPVTVMHLCRTMSNTVKIVLPLLADVEPVVPSTTGACAHDARTSNRARAVQ